MSWTKPSTGCIFPLPDFYAQHNQEVKAKEKLGEKNSMARQQRNFPTYTQHAKTWKVIVITLNKTVQVLYTENYEKLPREIKEDQNKYKDILCL